MSKRKQFRARQASTIQTKDVQPSGSMTIDSFQNFQSKLGIGTDNATSAGTYGLNPITRNRTLLEWAYRGSWLCGLGVDLPADDMTRTGAEIVGDLDTEDIEAIEEKIVDLDIWGSTNQVLKWGRLYGGAIGYNVIDGQDPSTPLRWDTVGLGQYKGILPLDRWQLTPDTTRFVSEPGRNQGLPMYYDIIGSLPGITASRIHYSRVFRSEGVTLPWWQKTYENYWGLSILERPWDRIMAFDSATTGAAQLVYKSYQRVLKMEGLRDAIANGGPVENVVLKTLEMMRKFASIEDISLIDAGDSLEGLQHSAFSGICDILVALGQQTSGSFKIPLVRLFGQAPTGLNSSGESDIRNYYDGIAADWQRMLKVPVTNIYRAVAATLGIDLPNGFGIKMRPLWQMSDKEKADIAASITETVCKGKEAGLISEQGAMKELKQSSAVTGIWTNITEEAIEAASDEIAPPPDPMGQPGEIGPDGLPIEGEQPQLPEGKKPIVTTDSDFKETEHPRAGDGKFGKGSRGSSPKWKEQIDPKYVKEMEIKSRGLGNNLLEHSDITYQDIPISDIETMTAKGEVHPESQNKWDKAIKEGKPMPVPVVHKTPEGKYFVLDGNHRAHALIDAGVKTVKVALLTPHKGYLFGKRGWFGTQEAADKAKQRGF